MFERLTILSLNVRGLQNNSKRRKLFTYLKECGADVYMLQETHATPSDARFWQTEWGATMLNACGDSKSRGCAILFSKKRSIQVHKIVSDEDGRFLIADVAAGSMRFTLANVYAPNADKPVFFNKFFLEVENCANPEMIIGGDFNLVLNAVKDRLPRANYNPSAQRKLLQLMDKHHLSDIWRVQNPETKQFSWCRYNPEFASSRLDFFLINHSIINPTRKVEYIPGLFTDHMGVSLTLDVSEYPRGPGYWKFNNKLLDDPKFVMLVNQTIDKVFTSFKECDYVTQWEMLKLQLTKLAQQAGKKRGAKLKEKFVYTQNCLALAKHAADINPTATTKTALLNAEAAMTALIAEKTQSAMFRSRARWSREGERTQNISIAWKSLITTKK